MNYNDMISTKCSSSASLAEVYECINQETFNISEMIPHLSQGASEPKCKLLLENIATFFKDRKSNLSPLIIRVSPLQLSRTPQSGCLT